MFVKTVLTIQSMLLIEIYRSDISYPCFNDVHGDATQPRFDRASKESIQKEVYSVRYNNNPKINNKRTLTTPQDPSYEPRLIKTPPACL